MSASAVREELEGDDLSAPHRLAVVGILNPRSLGVSRYASRLAHALAEEGIDYRLASRSPGADPVHYHLANSSRGLLVRRPSRDGRLVVTVHDVAPRTRALRPLYHSRVYPRLMHDAAAVVVHSGYAADLLVREAGTRPRRLEVIRHPAHRPRELERTAARRALGWPEDSLIAVLPGVIRPPKLVREVLTACASASGWRLALAGRMADAGAARAARAQGALVLADPDDLAYERAIVAADCVLCLRAGSVGETNGPLLDALGAGRAVLATPTGSIPEVAGGAARYCDGTPGGIRDGLSHLESEDARRELEREAAERAAELTWAASAASHAALFRDVFDG